MEEYERLLGDAMDGDPTLFAGQDEVDASWAIVEPVLRLEGPLYEYASGSAGPMEAARVVKKVGGWTPTQE
jgi:glucose-6-phosphate 1-dehydrogenase